jgi:hypothetical protein
VKVETTTKDPTRGATADEPLLSVGDGLSAGQVRVLAEEYGIHKKSDFGRRYTYAQVFNSPLLREALEILEKN